MELRDIFGPNINVLAFDEAPQLAAEGFSIQKFTQARPGRRVTNNLRVQTATYRTVLTGVKTGPLNIGPADTAPTVQLPQNPNRQPSRRGGGSGFGGFFGDDDDDFPFNNPFGNNMMRPMLPPQQVKVTAAAMPMEILPLPAGKPASASSSWRRKPTLAGCRRATR